MKKFLKKFIPKKLLNLRHLFYAWLGSVKYHHPSEELFVIGITGTSGKSSTVFLLRQILESAGFRVGSLSTIDFYIAGVDKLNDQKMTMLGKMQIQKYLREMVDKKCDIAIVETTSEGRVQHRHRFINYDMMVLTNLYPEHIESHGSFTAYKQAKRDIFEYVSTLLRKKNEKRIMNNEKYIPKIAIVNGNSEYAQEFLQYDFDKKCCFARDDQKLPTLDASSGRAFTNYQPSTRARVERLQITSNINVDKNGLHFTIANTQFDAPLFGEHNIMNITAAVSVARELGVEWNILQEAVSYFKSIPGRVEFIPEAEKFGFQVIVDYAFEPKAMSALYEVVDLLKPKRIIHVFGSTGGGRDTSRRSVLGEMIGTRADICIVTDEDPYEDDPMEIITDVAMAVEKTGKILDNNLFKILDRKDAIERAIGIAQEGDLILITGKGSEQAMCVAGGKKIAWDDREIVRQSILKKALHK